MFKRPRVEDVVFNPRTFELSFKTDERSAEIGILYFGRMLCSKTGCFYGTSSSSIIENLYLFDLERKVEVDGVFSEIVEPLYGGFLRGRGLIYVRCVRLGRGGIFPRQIHVAPICSLELEVVPERDTLVDEGIEVRLRGGKVLRCEYSCMEDVEFKICRVNESARLRLERVVERGRSGKFTWKPYVLDDGVKVFEDCPIKKGILSDLTMSTNSIRLSVGRSSVRLDVKKIRRDHTVRAKRNCFFSS